MLRGDGGFRPLADLNFVADDALHWVEVVKLLSFEVFRFGVFTGFGYMIAFAWVWR